MKRLLSLVCVLATGLFFNGCSGTNDRGVIINHPFDIFGAMAAPSSVKQAAPVTQPVSADPAPNA